MPKIKQNNSNDWKPLTLEGSVFSGGVDGLIGIEELTDYQLEEGNRKTKILVSDGKTKNEKNKVRKKIYSIDTL